MGQCPSHSSRAAIALAPRRQNTPEQSRRAQARWHKAARQIRWLLKLRRLWAALGGYLAQPQIKDLTRGLERKRGVLTRKRAA